MASIAAISIDVRTYKKGHKKDIIFKAFEKLEAGEIMELINDHDPRPLNEQFILNFRDEFEWNYSEQGPDIWKIEITKK